MVDVVGYNTGYNPDDGVVGGGGGPVEMSNLIAKDQGLKRVETFDTLNLTLHQCARDGNPDNMRRLLAQLSGNIRRKLNQLDEDKLAPIHYAARFNHLAIVKMLVEAGADLNIKGEDEATPLHFAARYTKKLKRVRSENELDQTDLANGGVTIASENNVTTVKLDGGTGTLAPPSEDEAADKRSLMGVDDEESVVEYLCRQGANVNAKDFYGSSPLHFASMRGNEEAARDMLRHSKIQIEAVDKQQMTALHIAATHDQVEICEMLINANINLRCCDDEMSTPLHMASSEGNAKIVRMLFDAGERKDGWVTISQMVTDQDIEKSTPLHIAVDNSHYDVTQILLDKGADVNTTKDGYNTPLHLAAVSGDLRIVQLLVDNHARIDALNSQQATPLHRASAFDHSDVVEYLLEKGAYIEKKDKDNFTPLLLAACYGHSNTIKVLLARRADLSAIDKNEKTPIFWAAEENKLEALKVLLAHPKAAGLINYSDRYDVEPLQIAAQNGFVDCVRLLLDNGADIDGKNEEEQTALHLAAKSGQTNVVRTLVKYNKMVVHDEDENSNTALHLAALSGHTKVAKVLLEAGADIEARNCTLWTPLDCAAARGFTKTARILLDNDCPVDPMDRGKITPLHLASKNGHSDMVKLLIGKGADVMLRDSEGSNCLDLAINNNNKDVATAIIKSDRWKDALRNETVDLKTGFRNTPLRKLIKRMPDVAEIIFHQCTTSNNENPDSHKYKITFDWEFLDDTYADWGDKSQSDSNSSSGGIYDEDTHRLMSSAKPYTNDTGVLKKNHPLNIMVTSRREDLLAHPLVTSLLRHKWNSYGRYVYYLNLILYVVFLVFLTAYIIVTPPPYTLLKDKVTITSGNVSDTSCDYISTYYNNQTGTDPRIQKTFPQIGKYVIIAMACWNLLWEIFQFYHARLNYFGWENLLEWITYVSALLLVIDFDECQRTYGAVRMHWQWIVGAICVFLAWMELVLFVRKFPRFGIYVVMFTDILRTFVQFFLVFLLFIIGFGLSFYMLLANQHAFRGPGEAMIKTAVMMIGEFEYDAIFNSAQDPANKNDYHAQLFYETPAYIIFIAFMILMSILIMNLLVGLAVDDIKAVQEQAVLKRLAMQVDLALDVEGILPQALRRKFVRKLETVKPNLGSTNGIKQFFNLDRSYLSSSALQQALDPELDEIEKIQEEQEKMKEQLGAIRLRLKDMSSTNHKLESMVSALLTHHGIDIDDNDDKDDDNR